MTASVLQEKNTFATGSGANISLAFTSNNTAGNAIQAIATWGSQVLTDFSSVTDTRNTYGAAQNKVVDTNDSQGIGQAIVGNIGAGANTVQANFNNTPSFRGIWIFEHTGVTASPTDGANSKYDPVPGTGTDAITSSTAANATQPVLMCGVCYDSGAGLAPSSGTGFTLGAKGWNNGTQNQATSENERFTNTTAKAATWTASTSACQSIAVMAMFDEAAAGGAAIRLMFPWAGDSAPGVFKNDRIH